MRAFLAYLQGEPRVCSMVHVPTVEDEDRKRRTRERERLLKERTSHSNRIKGLLLGQGVRDVQPLKPGFIASLDKMRTGDGRMLTPWLKEEIVREHERLCLVVKQLSALEAANKAVLRAATPGSAEARMLQLVDLKSIGPIGGQELVNEVFYRSFGQSPPDRQLFRAHRHTLRQRREPPRAGHQQGRQPAGPQACDRARLAVGTTPARQRTQRLVPSARRRDEGTAAPRRHRGAGTQADGGALALS
jgi:transposase